MADIKAIKGTNNTTYSIVDRYSEWGGYNILPGTAFWDCMANKGNLIINGNEASISANNTNNKSEAIPCSLGDVFTMSVDAKASGEKTYQGGTNYFWLIDLLNSSGSRVDYIVNPTTTLTTDWQRISWTFEITNSNIKKFTFGFRNYISSPPTVTMRHLKIEKGHKATDWSPCWTDIFTYANEQITMNI